MALGSMTSRPALLFAIEDSHGCVGWGEVWANFPNRASLHKKHVIEDVVAPKLKGLSFSDPREAVQALRDQLSIYFLHVGQVRVLEHILAGIDTALWDLALRSAGESFAEHMGVDPQAKCYASSINRDALEAKISKHSAYDQNRFKLKLGFGDEEDIAFVERAAGLTKNDARLMVDTNQRWSRAQAQIMLKRLAPLGVQFSEEPLRADATLADWEALAETSTIPLAVGENVYGIDAFLALVDAGIQYVQPDVAKWGGVSGALDLADALPSNAMLWPHFMGSAVGQMAALSVAAAVGGDAQCEMDVNANALRTDLCGGALEISRGAVSLPISSGLVVPPEPDQLSRFAEGAAS